ncbi:MAG: helix-turn-helix transcriptional regulator [Schleiferiaceae bacterium]
MEDTINTSKSTINEGWIEEGVKLYVWKGEANETRRESIPSGVIQFYFAVEGECIFKFGPHYQKELGASKSFFIYNPDKEIQVEWELPVKSQLVFIFISIEKLHKLFLSNTAELPFLSGENANRKFYEERSITPQLMVPLNQLLNNTMPSPVAKVYNLAKAYEILGISFDVREPNIESCPFLNDEENIRKIKHAKEILVERMTSPPTLKELSELVDINEYRLKAGFKEIYGNTVFGFLLDYKLEHSLSLLQNKNSQIHQVADELGYTNPSHYIAAFKKKYGVTPKKYLLQRG